MCTLFRVKDKELGLLSPMMPDDILSWAAENDDIRVYGIEENEQTIGCAAANAAGSRAELLWYYLADTCRGYGIGRECFFNLLSDLRDAGADEVSAGLYEDTDRSLVRLLGAYRPDYEPTEVCHVSFPAAVVNNIPELLKPSVSCVALRACSKEDLEALRKKLAAEDKDTFDVTADGYNTAISAVYKKDGEAQGALLFKRKNSHEITLFFAGSVAKDSLVMMDMLRFSCAMIRQLPPGTIIGINLVDRRMKDFMLSLMKDVKDVKIEQGKVAVLPLAYVDRIRDRVDAMLAASKELAAI